ncbi:MAG: hypothetical protein KAS32_01625 [Candidatus Peribacteraceae bacterium]|nr:hypothetical protein [Candidatus Peribacteraceae bacterium]
MQEKKDTSWIWKLFGVIIVVGIFILFSSAFLYLWTIDSYSDENNTLLPDAITAWELLDDYNNSINGFESYSHEDSVYLRDIVLRIEYNTSDEPRIVLWFASIGLDYEYTAQTEIKCFRDTPPGCFELVKDQIRVGESAILEIKIIEYEVDGELYEGLVVWDVVNVANSGQ